MCNIDPNTMRNFCHARMLHEPLKAGERPIELRLQVISADPSPRPSWVIGQVCRRCGAIFVPDEELNQLKDEWED